MRDILTRKAYRSNLLGVWDAVPGMLELFEQYGIHATWATVGFIYHEDLASLQSSRPRRLPSYEDVSLCPYAYVDSLRPDEFEAEEFSKKHFAKPLIDQIFQTPHQEIATHTYSHYYTAEPSIDPDGFEADLQKAVAVALDHGISIDSLVFPRNQIDRKSLERVPAAGIRVYRGNPDHWAYRDGETGKTFKRRVFRLLDGYVNLSGEHVVYPRRDESGLVDAKGSMFLRPYSSRLRLLEKRKLKRIQDAMTSAAQTGGNFHLWWHPHNFGVNLPQNLANLEAILKHFKRLHQAHGMCSLSMRELGEYCA
jgi:peptidoglycan/xylan/chitin deacetylase (PgdA/CDA1 family)